MLEIDNDVSSPFGTYSLSPLQKVVLSIARLPGLCRGWATQITVWPSSSRSIAPCTWLSGWNALGQQELRWCWSLSMKVVDQETGEEIVQEKKEKFE